MRLSPDLLLGRPLEELFDAHSSPTEILSRLEAEQRDELPEDFLSVAAPREPDDLVAIRGTKTEAFDRRSWKEEATWRDEEFHRMEFADPPSGTISTTEFEDVLETEHRSIISHEYGTCPECDGSPESDCERCGGDATLECDDCRGVGSNPCTECEGAGEITCPTCEGEQHLPCETCDGDGELLVEDDCPNCTDGVIRVKETCSKCQGEGKVMKDGEEVPCSRCSGGWFSSGGVVSVENTCSACGGRGGTRRRTTCPDCGGSQVRECEECRTTGSVRCDRCDGDETVACDPCDGSGSLPCPDCGEGTVICSVCEGDREVHTVVFRHTVIRPDSADIALGKLPNGIANPDWETHEPTYLELERRAGTTVATPTTEIDVDRIEDGQYVRVDSRYVTIRSVTYDYGERNFTVREMNGDLYYTRYPEREPPGLFDRIRNLF